MGIAQKAIMGVIAIAVTVLVVAEVVTGTDSASTIAQVAVPLAVVGGVIFSLFKK